MGQLKDKRIVQSRVWLEPNPSPIPQYDYDYTYPISVYEAIKRNMDDNATNLSDELDSIYRLINEKQNIIEAGIPGNVMTWTGTRGNIGSIEILKMINSDPSLRSHQKLVSERAIGDILDSKVSAGVFNAHINETSIHVTDIEKNRWNSMAPLSTLHSHINNIAMHITEAERGRWNNKADQSFVDDHVYNINNPHNVTAHQVGTYSRKEIDNMFENLRESFFNYLNIYWDDRQSKAELVEYHATNWNPNYVLEYSDSLPEVENNDSTYFALKPATDYKINESQDCIIYIKRPGMIWQEVGFQTMDVGDMVIRYPDTAMYVWVQGRFMGLFTGASGGSGSNGSDGEDGSAGGTGGNSDMMWRPVIDETTGTLTWVKSKSSDPPGPYVIKGKDGYNPIKGIDYNDGKDGVGVPPGGMTGEVLVKMTDENFETTWKNIIDVLGDLIISGGGLPAGIISWDMIKGRPEWYNELGDNEDGFITQRAATRQFEIVNNSISELLEKIIGNGGLDSVKEDLYAHINDFSNPHRVTTAQIGAVSVATFTEHVQNFHNPHNVTAQQIGLGNVNNTSDMDKPISNAVQEALDDILDKIGIVTGNVSGINYVDTVNWSDHNTTLTFIYKDGTEVDVQIPITDIFNNIYFDPVEGELVIVLPDGNENRIDISAMIKVYSGSMSKNIQVEVSTDNIIKASILPNTIGEDELKVSVHLPGSPTTTTQPVTDRSTRIATTEFVRNQVIDNLISYETDRALSANMGRILNQRKVDIEDIMEIINDLEAIDVIDNLESTNSLAALSANMGRYLDLTKAPRVHTSSSPSTFGRATISLFGHARASDIDPLMDGTVFRGTDDGYYARADHRHPTDSSRAPVHFPDVTNGIDSFTGEPKTTVPPDDSNDTRIPTTSWIRRNAVGVQMGECDSDSYAVNKIVVLRSDFMEEPVFMRQTGSTVSVTFLEDDLAEDTVFMDVQGSGPAMVVFGGLPIVNGMIKANHTYTFTFDGTNWRLMNPSGIHTLPDDDNSNSFISSEWVRRNLVGVTKGESATAGGNPNKVATLRSTFMDPVVFMRQIGTTIAITFEHEDRSGDTPTTLNVNGTGAAKVLFAGGPLSTGMIGKNHTHMFVFDGENWRLINPVPGTGIGGPDGITIGPGTPPGEDDPEDPENPTPEMIINQDTGHIGFTIVGDNGADDDGQVDEVWVTLQYAPKAGGVEVTLAEEDTAWAVKFGDGTIRRVTTPVVREVNETSAIIQFTLMDVYPSNSPCHLLYRTNKAWINIKEL